VADLDDPGIRELIRAGIAEAERPRGKAGKPCTVVRTAQSAQEALSAETALISTQCLRIASGWSTRRLSRIARDHQIGNRCRFMARHLSPVTYDNAGPDFRSRQCYGP
jgi:hypothetical protein